jgi:homoserine kinase
MRARVPASSANLGPGFDTLAVALPLYVEVSIEEAEHFSMVTTGEGADRFAPHEHAAVQLATRLLGHDRFAMTVSSQIPLSRGLGSSAALAVAVAAAAGHPDPLKIGTEVDGHAENAAASVTGGLVAATVRHGEIISQSLSLDPRWRFVVTVPDVELATADARRALPTHVSLHDASSNLGSLALLIAGLANRDAWHDHAMEDVLHQPYRMPLLPFSAPLLASLRDAGAAGTCWSGAGSTMLALVTAERAIDVAAAAENFLESNSVSGIVHVMSADTAGLVLS